MRKYKFICTIVVLISGVTGASFLLSSCNKDRDLITVEYIDKIKLRKLPFDDKNLSNPVGQSCSSCYVGGFFLGGRVNTLEQQSQKPFLNPLGMNNSSVQKLIGKIKEAAYYSLYKQVYGAIADTITVFSNIADSISSFEKSPDLNPFSSKYDYYLKGNATPIVLIIKKVN